MWTGVFTRFSAFPPPILIPELQPESRNLETFQPPAAPSRSARPQVRSPEFVFGAVADGDEEDGAFAFGVGREEAGHVVVEEGKASGAQPLGVGSQI